MLLLTHKPAQSFEDEIFTHLEYITHPECNEDLYYVPFTLLGCGYFSSVWAIPGEPFQVLKVSHRESDACRYYMQWAREHPHPNAPKIYDITYRDNLMLVRMERYYRHPDYDDHINREDVPGHRVLCQGHIPAHNLGHEQLCAQIRRVFRGHKFDLHRENIMVNRHGTIIITDPVSFSEGYTS